MASATTAQPAARPDKFAAWLAGQGENLQAAYQGLTSSGGVSSNQLAPAVAQRIVQHVASKPELEKMLFAIWHRIAATKEAVKDKAGYSYKQLAKALGQDFR